MELEYILCKELNNTEIKELKGFWCDGIAWYNIEHLLSVEHILNTKQIITNAWIGKDGQGNFQTIIHLGEHALNNYKQNKELLECIPDIDSEWIEIDHKKNTIQLYLK